MEPQQTTGGKLSNKYLIGFGIVGIIGLMGAVLIPGNLTDQLQSRFTKTQFNTSKAYEAWSPSPDNPARKVLNEVEMEKLDAYYLKHFLTVNPNAIDASGPVQRSLDLRKVKDEVLPKLRAHSQLQSSPQKAKLLAVVDYLEFEIADYIKNQNAMEALLFAGAPQVQEAAKLGSQFGSCKEGFSAGQTTYMDKAPTSTEGLCKTGNASNLKESSGQVTWVCGDTANGLLNSACGGYVLQKNTLQFRVSKASHLLTDDTEFFLGDTLYSYILTGDASNTKVCIEGRGNWCNEPKDFIPITQAGWSATGEPGRYELRDYKLDDSKKLATGNYIFHVTLSGSTIQRPIKIDYESSINAKAVVTFHSPLDEVLTSVKEGEKFTIRVTGTNNTDFKFCINAPGESNCFNNASKVKSITIGQDGWTHIPNTKSVQFVDFAFPAGSPKGLYRIEVRNGDKATVYSYGIYLD